jgi:hypothetical protein
MEARALNYSDLSIWRKKLGVRDPTNIIYFSRPNLKTVLLKEGLATLKDPASASADDRTAQLMAKLGKKGLWAEISLVPLRRAAPPKEKTKAIGVEEIKSAIALWGGIAAVIATLIGIGRLVYKLTRRRKVPLLFLGVRGVGKTWLWSRMINPDISVEELNKIETSNEVRIRRASKPEPMGRYEVTPKYIDTPGGMPGQQVTELMGRKRVWIIILSPNSNKAVTIESREDLKVNSQYVAEQFGYLSLPLGLMASPKAKKPTLVILAISKVDLFSTVDPSRREFEEAKKKLSRIFSRHIAAIKDECDRRGIPHQVEYCSALLGWRTESVLRHVKGALFA